MAVLTISKETGCGDEVCAIVADKLRYKIVNNEITHYAAILSNTPHEKAEKLDDRHYSRRSAFISDYLDMSFFKPEELLLPPKEIESSQPYEYAETSSGEGFRQTTERVIRMFANEDNIIIVGRGGNFVLKDHPNTLHVRFVAPLELRTRNIMRSQGINEKEARTIAKEVDIRKSKYMKHHFKSDITDPANYHVVVNLGMVTIENAATFLISALTFR
ncbi:MAG: cytidylate kinase-like family protein [Deferribacteraceae bacterium]|jgi:cytidylate kinase|nr:cytidylate kinase-like family protein [Deferribacteraceae bacterium]